jgi:hypothetical protein
VRDVLWVCVDAMLLELLLTNTCQSGMLDDSSRWGRRNMHTLPRKSDGDMLFGWKTDEFPYICMGKILMSAHDLQPAVAILTRCVFCSIQDPLDEYGLNVPASFGF